MFGRIPVKQPMKVIAVSTIAMVLVGCVQTPKHTNTLMFATNTDWGVKVGTDEKQIPVIRIGYKRQEGAFIPVLANTAVDENGELIPCPSAVIKEDDTSDTIKVENLEDCKFVGTHDGVNKDSYSTLASFGGKTGVDVQNGTSTGATVAIAQYFATGIAAQYLAVTGGANVVSAGGDSKAKADATAAAANAIAEKEKANAKRYVTTIETGRVIAKAMLGNSSDPVDAGKRKALADKIGVGACDDAKLGKFDQRSVKQFLDEMQAQEFQCLVRLANNSAK